MIVLVNNDDLDGKLEDWESLVETSENILLGINIVVHCLLFIVYFVALSLIFCYYKRKEVFLWAIPTLFLAEVFFGGVYWVLYINESDRCDKTGQCDPLLRWPYTLSIFTSYLPHLLFAS